MDGIYCMIKILQALFVGHQYKIYVLKKARAGKMAQQVLCSPYDLLGLHNP